VASTRLYLVRHGATQLTAEDRFAGAVGVDLSDEGRWQVGRLAERLTPEPIRAVYCSPLGRTVETALLAKIAADARDRGAVWLQGRFIPTRKNAPAADFYRDHGFAEGEAGLWRLDLSKNTIEVPAWIKVVP